MIILIEIFLLLIFVSATIIPFVIFLIPIVMILFWMICLPAWGISMIYTILNNKEKENGMERSLGKIEKR